ncbi:hypothetical protein CYD30_07590 [Kosakonia cowanii]|nr:hypothetical protein CYD30_07590 [Kosakonia cowanii]
MFAGIRFVCEPDLASDIEKYFHSEGLELSRPACFADGIEDKLTLVFRVATQAKDIARSLMGLLNRNDVEIELHLCTGDREPQTAIVKLRDVKNVEACERLVDKLAGVIVRHRQSDRS